MQKSLPRGSRPAKGSTTSSTGSGTDGNRVDQKTNASSAVSSSSPTVTEAFTGKPSSGSIGIGVGGTTGNGNGTDNSSGKGNGNGNGNGKRNGSHDGAETADSAGPEPAKKGRKKKKRGKEGEFVVAEGGGGGGGQGQGARGAGIKWPVHPTTVFVRGLGLTATSGMLRDAFAGVGALVEARVVADKKTQETKVWREKSIFFAGEAGGAERAKSIPLDCLSARKPFLESSRQNHRARLNLDIWWSSSLRYSTTDLARCRVLAAKG